MTHPQLEPLLNHQAKLAVERVVLLSRLPFTILQPMHYMQNLDVARVVAGGVLRQPYTLDTPLAHVDLEDVAEVAALVVAYPQRHRFATYELCGDDFHSAHELARIISAAAGRPVVAELTPFATGVHRGARTVRGRRLSTRRIGSTVRPLRALRHHRQSERPQLAARPPTDEFRRVRPT